MKARVQRWRTALAAAAVGLLAGMAGGSARGATLSVNGPDQAGGETLAYAVSLVSETGERVAALQFDAQFDQETLAAGTESGAVPGAAAKTAEKSVHAATTRPGTLRVIIAGLNQNVIGNGDVAVLQFARRKGPESAPGKVSLTNVVMSDPMGREVTVRDSTGTPVHLSTGGGGSSAAPDASDRAPRMGIVYVAAVLAIAGTGGWFLTSRKRVNRRRSRP